MFKMLMQRWHIAVMVIIVIVKNWFLEAVPFVPRSGFPIDDALFIKQAESIVGGNWLGDFNQYTLIKGPIYPLWIALNYFLGLSIIHAQDILYLLACLVVVRAVSVDIKSKLAIVLIFSVLYLNPVSFDFASISHAFRQAIYGSFSLMVFGALLGLLLRLSRSGRWFYAWSLLFGFAFSMFWYTREEGVWVLPSIILVALVSLGAALIGRRWRVIGRGIIGFILVPASMWFATTSILIHLNTKYYEAPYVVEVLTPNFERVYNTLLSIEPVAFRRYFPVRADTMERVLDLSDKAAELTAFRGHTDFRGSQFIWGLRQSVAHAGYYDKGAKAVDQYYSDLADELEALCENKTFECHSLLLSNVPPWKPIYTEEFGRILAKQIKEVVRFKGFSTSQTGWYAYGNDNYIKTVERLTHARIQIRENEVSFKADKFLIKLDQFKSGWLQTFGEIQLNIRPALFYLAFIILLFQIMRNLIFRQYNPYTLYSLALFGGLLTLCVGLTIIELTAYSSLFRPKHGVFPIPPLFIIMVILSLTFNPKHRDKAE